MGEFRGLSRLVSTDLGPHSLPQQSTTSATFLKYGTQKCAFDAVVVSEAVPTPTV
jgi:hypothetical protein